MSRLRVCTVIGTRPEAIKLAPVIKFLDQHPGVEQRVLVTGQHRELLDQTLELFEIRPAHDLRVMQDDQRLGALTAHILEAVEQDLAAFRRDWVIVQGDTTTALAAALAAYYRGVPVAHVEAGLRTYDRYNPFPEEVNRRFIDHLAQLHFAPTERARQNLLQEGIDAATIRVTGSTSIDALREIDRRSGRSLPLRIEENGLRLLLVTGHRRENFGPALLNICHALRTLVMRNPDVHVVFAVHLNPNVKIPVWGELEGVPRIQLTGPLDYVQFVQLMKRSFVILTDSGGIQEEAPSLGKPVLVLREQTERIEAIEAGSAKLIGTSPEKIVKETEELLRDSTKYARMAQTVNLYGDGHAAEVIVNTLVGAPGAVDYHKRASSPIRAAKSWEGASPRRGLFHPPTRRQG